MADNKTTPQGVTPETQENIGQVDNTPEQSKLEATRNVLKNTVLAISGFGLGALGIIGPGNVQAGGLPPDELVKQEKAIIEANGGVINQTDLKGQLVKLEVKNPDEVFKKYNLLEAYQQVEVSKYIKIGLSTSSDFKKMGNGVEKFINGFYKTTLFNTFMRNPTPENDPESGTTSVDFIIAQKAFPLANTIITDEDIANQKSLDKNVSDMRKKTYNEISATAQQRSAIARQESAVAEQEIAVIKDVTEGVEKIKQLSKDIKKGAGI